MDDSAALSPLPEHVLPFFLDVLRDVRPALAVPFVKASLQQVLAVQVDDVVFRNVVFKLQLTHHAHGEDWYLSLLPNSSLKKWQALCPESATLLIRETRTHCQFCDSSTLVMETMAKWIGQQTSSGYFYEPSAGVTLCRVFTPCAGIQLAAFQPAKCTDCLRVYLGGWSFKRSHSRAVDCRWLGPCPQHLFCISQNSILVGCFCATARPG